MQNTIDKKFIHYALRLAKKGEKRVAPNPMVGCVVVKDGVIVGKGYHEYFGGPHAEINALRQAGKKAEGATLYVTLEPCSHWGKTPPCTDAIIRAKIASVVAATADPNPKIAGKGLKKLAAHGIKVRNNVLAKEAKALNSTYIRSITKARSRVIVKAAMTLDGKIAASGGDSRWITSPASRRLVHRLRSEVDGILVGVNTVINDDPSLTSHGREKNPVRVIIDPGLKTPLNSKVLDGSAPTVIIYANDAKNKVKALNKMNIITARVLIMNGRIDFKSIIKVLSKMSIHKILIEGGGETVAHALESSVVNEVYFFIAPKIIGGRDAKTPVEGRGIARMAKAIKVRSVKTLKIGCDLLIRGVIR